MTVDAPATTANKRNSIRVGLLATLVLHVLGGAVLFWFFWDGPKLDRLLPVIFFSAFQLIWMVPAFFVARSQSAGETAKGLAIGAAATVLIHVAGIYWASY